jgi:hypothetical protein
MFPTTSTSTVFAKPVTSLLIGEFCIKTSNMQNLHPVSQSSLDIAINQGVTSSKVTNGAQYSPYSTIHKNMSFDSSISSAMVAVSQESSLKPSSKACGAVEDCVSPTELQTQSPPPVGEIRIPTLSLDSLDTITTNSDVRYNSMEDYKTLYFCGQQDLFRTQQRMECVCEENRLLKRKLIELQRQLFHNSRTKRRVVKANLAWSIPENSPQTPVKRLRMSPNDLDEQDKYVTVSPGASTRSSDKRLTKVQFETSEKDTVSEDAR